MMPVIFDATTDSAFREVFDGKAVHFSKAWQSGPSLLCYSDHRTDCQDGSDENPATCGQLTATFFFSLANAFSFKII